MSVLLFAGERVYKLKQPVDLGFLDFRDPATRRRACEDEVRLNRRLAPGVYRGVVRIVRGPAGHLAVGGDGEVVETAVEMARLPADRMLDALLARDAVEPAVLDDVAALLARFHAAAATGPGVDEHGSPDAIAFNVRENLAQTAAHVGSTVSARLHAFLSATGEAGLAGLGPLLKRRVREGRIRDGHGDLHAGNICLADEGIVVYDCIEFAPRLRCGDVACDLAFLTMDLAERGHPGLADRLVDAYATAAGDPELRALLPFYEQYRAIVRAKVLGLAAADRSRPTGEREACRRSAAGYWLLAAGYSLPPALLLTCGLPAAGKSTLAGHLARALRAPLLASDVHRKQLAGLASTERAGAAFGEGLYGREVTDRVYAALLDDARAALAGGRSVVVDATFPSRERRRPFLRLADELGVRLLLVEAHVPEHEARSRLAARANDPAAVSDADLAVYEQARAAFEPPDELREGQAVAIDARGPGIDLAGRVFDFLLPAS